MLSLPWPGRSHSAGLRCALLAVRPTHRRLGIGQRLFEWLLESARCAGMASIHLELRAGTDAARRFSRAMGVYETVLVPGYYRSGERPNPSRVRRLRALPSALRGRLPRLAGAEPPERAQGRTLCASILVKTALLDHGPRGHTTSRPAAEGLSLDRLMRMVLRKRAALEKANIERALVALAAEGVVLGPPWRLNTPAAARDQQESRHHAPPIPAALDARRA